MKNHRFTLERESEEEEVSVARCDKICAGWPGKSPDPVLQPYFNIQYQLLVWGTTAKCLARGQRLVVPNKL